MAANATQFGTVSSNLIEQWGQVGQKLVSLVEEFPESKFDYKPIAGVRTFADVLRHVAFWNRYLADCARGRKSDDGANELSSNEYSTKKQLLEVLKQSTLAAADALKREKSGLTAELCQTLVTFIEHNGEHYGQLVVYARLNRIVPPLSRG
jgi:hypothetical protein